MDFDFQTYLESPYTPLDPQRCRVTYFDRVVLSLLSTGETWKQRNCRKKAKSRRDQLAKEFLACKFTPTGTPDKLIIPQAQWGRVQKDRWIARWSACQPVGDGIRKGHRCRIASCPRCMAMKRIRHLRRIYDKVPASERLYVARTCQRRGRFKTVQEVVSFIKNSTEELTRLTQNQVRRLKGKVLSAWVTPRKIQLKKGGWNVLVYGWLVITGRLPKQAYERWRGWTANKKRHKQTALIKALGLPIGIFTWPAELHLAMSALRFKFRHFDTKPQIQITALVDPRAQALLDQWAAPIGWINEQNAISLESLNTMPGFPVKFIQSKLTKLNRRQLIRWLHAEKSAVIWFENNGQTLVAIRKLYKGLSGERIEYDGKAAFILAPEHLAPWIRKHWRAPWALKRGPRIPKAKRTIEMKPTHIDSKTCGRNAAQLNELNRLEVKIASIYARRKAMYFPLKRVVRRRKKGEFMQAAKIILKNPVNLEGFINWRFQQNRPHLPGPLQLASRDKILAFKDHLIKDRTNRLNSDIRWTHNAIKARVGGPLGIKGTLEDAVEDIERCSKSLEIDFTYDPIVTYVFATAHEPQLANRLRPYVIAALKTGHYRTSIISHILPDVLRLDTDQPILSTSP